MIGLPPWRLFDSCAAKILMDAHCPDSQYNRFQKDYVEREKPDFGKEEYENTRIF